ncbi:MAG: YfhO family protein, partial [Armatimonadetes bacterium]|nr:YfhO family protein [Armatimonadota bacterium]
METATSGGAAEQGKRPGRWQAMARRHPLVVAGLVLSAVLLLAFPGAVSLRRVPFVSEMVAGSDLTHFGYPMRFLLSEGVRHGRIPLWTDRLNGGFPAHAEGQGGFLYPLNLLLAPLPLPAAIDLFFLITYVGAGLLMFLYAREVGQSRRAALLSAMVFAYSGFFLGHIRHMNILASAQWLPLLLLLVERYARTGRPVYLLAVAPAQALQHLAGHPQVTYYSLLFTGVYLLARVLFQADSVAGSRGQEAGDGDPSPVTGPPSPSSFFAPRWRRTLLALLGFAAVTVLGAGLAGAQLLPSFELAQLSDRPAKGSLTQATFHTLPLEHLVTFIHPFAMGDPGRDTYNFLRGRDSVVFWENIGYVGLLPLALALFAIRVRARRNRRVLLLAAAALLSLLLAMGKQTPLFPFLWRHFPGMDAFRVAGRFLLITDFALAALAGFGLDALLSRIPAGAGRLRLVIAALVLALTAADLSAFGARQCALVEADRWLAPSAAAQTIAAQNRPARVVTWGYAVPWLEAIDHNRGWQRNPEGLRPLLNALLPNHSVLQGIPQFACYSGFTLADKELVLGCWSALSSAGSPQAIRLGLRLLGTYHVGYVVASGDYRPGGAEEIRAFPVPGSTRAFHLYRNPHVLPRAYLVERAQAGGSPQQTLQRLLAAGFDPRRTVILGESLDPESESRGGKREPPTAALVSAGAGRGPAG